MGPHYLDRLFSPHAVAVIGANDREDSVGMRVFANMRQADFTGALYPVNPKHDTVQGEPCFPTLEAIGKPVDMAVIATPAATVPELIRQCGEYGVRVAIVLSAGFGETGDAGADLQRDLMESARRAKVRIVGPNCLGVLRPHIGLNATFSRNAARAGPLALVSQSGALCTAILDWALDREVGFSAVVSLGDAADVDFGDVLDFLSLDPQTHSILLYVEGIHEPRSFMSGLRSAARMKPVIVVKAGRRTAGSRAAMSHTGALAGGDDVFNAALDRAGAVRAMTVEQLFSAAQILAGQSRVAGNGLGIVTNAGGPGVMAADRAADLDVVLPELAPQTLSRLNAVLPPQWSHGNPVDILGDAGPARYAEALEALGKDDGIHGILTMLTPQAMTQPDEAAAAVIDATRKIHKPVLTCWMGGGQVDPARQAFSSARLPHFTTPEAAVEAFADLANYRRNQALLLQVPGPLSDRTPPDVDGARLIIEGTLSEGRTILNQLEAKAVLAAFHVPVMQALAAHNPTEALVAAESLGFPVAMKIDSPDITHKTDVSGVRLNIADAQSVRTVYKQLVDETARQRPSARIAGVTVEPMYTRPHGRELLIGVVRDPVFGPVIGFGAGGTAVEILRDRALALPPLNRYIARTLIQQTRIASQLAAFRNMPAAHLAALESALLRVSEMVCELPHIQELDINPLIADEQGVLAVDARIVVDFPPAGTDRFAHMAIHPYPSHLVHHLQLADGTNIVIRPIRPEDAEIEQTFVRGLSERAKYFRFVETLQELTPAMLIRFTQIDYDREMALIAVTEDGGKEVEIGVARYVTNPDGETCEFALVVADAWQRKGIGSGLMDRLMDIAKTRGLKTMEGEVLANNEDMLGLVRHLGFSVRSGPDDPGLRRVAKRL